MDFMGCIMEDDEFVCERCGCKESWSYIGESYDDEIHLGSLYECMECGNRQCDGDTGGSDFRYYDEIGE